MLQPCHVRSIRQINPLLRRRWRPPPPPHIPQRTFVVSGRMMTCQIRFPAVYVVVAWGLFRCACPAGRAERHCICELDPRYRLAPRIVHAWTHNCSIWSRLSWQLLHSGFGRSGACVSTRLPYVCVSRYSKCVCVCVDTLACVFRRKGTKGRARSLNVRFPAVTPRLVLQWPCLPLCESVCVSVCVCVCGGGVRLLSHSLVFSRFSELCGVNAEITCWVMSDGPNYRLNNE